MSYKEISYRMRPIRTTLPTINTFPFPTRPLYPGPRSTSTTGRRRTHRFCGVLLPSRGRRGSRAHFGRARCGWPLASANQSWTVMMTHCTGGAWKAATQRGTRRRIQPRPSWRTNVTTGGVYALLCRQGCHTYRMFLASLLRFSRTARGVKDTSDVQ